MAIFFTFRIVININILLINSQDSYLMEVKALLDLEILIEIPSMYSIKLLIIIHNDEANLI